MFSLSPGQDLGSSCGQLGQFALQRVNALFRAVRNALVLAHYWTAGILPRQAGCRDRQVSHLPVGCLPPPALQEWGARFNREESWVGGGGCKHASGVGFPQQPWEGL